MTSTSKPPSTLLDRPSDEEGASLRSKSVKGAAYMAGAGAIESFVRLAATVVLARLLSPAEIGLVAMVIVLLGFIEFIKDLGLGIVTMQQPKITHEEVSSLFWINVLLGIGFALIFSACSPLIAKFYNDPRLIPISIWLATSLVLGGIVVQPEAILFRQMRQGTLAFIRLAATILSSVVAIFMAIEDFSIWALVAREVARAAFYTVGVFLWLKWRPALTMHLHGVIEHLKFGTNLSFAFVITALTGKIDAIFVGRFFGATDLGLYRQAQGLIVAPIEQFNAPIFNVAQPALSSLQNEGDRYCRYYQRMTGFVAMVTMPIGVFLSLYADEFILALLGRKWAGAGPYVTAFALALALRPTLHGCTMVLVTLGRTKPLIGLELTYSAIYLLCILVAIQINAVAVAYAFFVATVLFIPLRIHRSFKDTPVSARAMFAAIRNPMIATALMGCALVVMERSTHQLSAYLSLPIGIATAAISYAAAWLLIPGGRAELLQLLKDVRGALQRRRGASAAA